MVQIDNIQLPNKIFIFNDGKQNFNKEFIVCIKNYFYKPIFAFMNNEDENLEFWLFPEELHHIKYIDYEKYLKLKAFL